MFKQIFAFLAVIASAQAFAPVSQTGALFLLLDGSLSPNRVVSPRHASCI